MEFIGKQVGRDKHAIGILKRLKSAGEIFRIMPGEAVILSDEISFDDVLTFYRAIKKGAVAIVAERDCGIAHGPIAAKEMGVPCIVNTGKITIKEGSYVTITGNKLSEGRHENESVQNPDYGFKQTKRLVKINLGFPEAVIKQPELAKISDGVGFMRLEFVMQDILNGVHPVEFVRKLGERGVDLMAEKIALQIKPVADLFRQQGKSIMVRTDDFSPKQLASFEGGHKFETREENPAMGWRGISRNIRDNEMILPQFTAIKYLENMNFSNIGLFPAMTRKCNEFAVWKKMAEKEGIHERFGVMVETPSAALTLQSFIDEGAEFVVIGSNDLTSFTLAIDRSNHKLSSEFSESDPAVLRLFKMIIGTCVKNEVECIIGGQAASNTGLMKHLFDFGISGFSVNPDSRTVLETRYALSQLEK